MWASLGGGKQNASRNVSKCWQCLTGREVTCIHLLHGRPQVYLWNLMCCHFKIIHVHVSKDSLKSPSAEWMLHIKMPVNDTEQTVELLV